jgi:hypothetical protein
MRPRRADRLKGGKDVGAIARIYDATPVDELANALRRCAGEDVVAEVTARAPANVDDAEMLDRLLGELEIVGGDVPVLLVSSGVRCSVFPERRTD